MRVDYDKRTHTAVITNGHRTTVIKNVTSAERAQELARRLAAATDERGMLYSAPRPFKAKRN